MVTRQAGLRCTPLAGEFGFPAKAGREKGRQPAWLAAAGHSVIVSGGW